MPKLNLKTLRKLKTFKVAQAIKNRETIGTEREQLKAIYELESELEQYRELVATDVWDHIAWDFEQHRLFIIPGVCESFED